MSNEKEAVPARTASTDTTLTENTAERPKVKMTARDMVISGNLVTVDLDSDAHVEPFLAANPAFRNALQTRGSRGAQFWFIGTDDYPKEVRKLEINGTTENAGEFRGGRCLSTIWGVHENGNVYSRVNDVPPINFAFDDMQWPTGWKCIEPKNNFKFSSNGNHNTGRPLASKRGKGRRIDWDRFNEELKDGSGIVQSLAERWFSDAVLEGDEWSCGDITGRAQNGKGSFHIYLDGSCIDFDGSWNRSSVVNAIISDYRRDLSDETITIEDVFEGILKDTGKDFFKAQQGLMSTTFGTLNRKRSSCGTPLMIRGHCFQPPC